LNPLMLPGVGAGGSHLRDLAHAGNPIEESVWCHYVGDPSGSNTRSSKVAVCKKWLAASRMMSVRALDSTAAAGSRAAALCFVHCWQDWLYSSPMFSEHFRQSSSAADDKLSIQ
jgi:hypothetical protein